MPRPAGDQTPPVARWLPATGQAAVRTALLDWYQHHGRPLPWAGERDPYRVWLREIMLQQTTVSAVVPYLARFLDRFPTLADLARAEEAAVLRLWEGLGYYSRARNLHRAAKVIVDQHGGQFPADVTALLELPGVGRYTAGAIASFAFDHPAPIVEANTLRLYSRLMGLTIDPRSTAGQRALWAVAQEFVDLGEPASAARRRQASPPKTAVAAPRIINQALMDLGATVCTVQQPLCPQCPLLRWCRAAATNQQAAIPVPAARPVITPVTEATIAVAHQGRYLLRQRAAGERWAGLWDFPRFPVPEGQTAETVLLEATPRLTGVAPQHLARVLELVHGVTRYRITLLCFTGRARTTTVTDPATMRWVAPDEFSDYPLSVTGRKLAMALQQL